MDRQGNGSGSTAFAVAADLFSASATGARQVFQPRAQADRAMRPTPGDGLELDKGPSVTGRSAGKRTLSVDGSQTAGA